MDIPDLNLYSLFHTVARCGNISLAAKKLYLSQSAVSKAVTRLENALQTTLFIRSSRGVKLTMAGEILYRQVSDALGALSLGERQVRRIQHFNMGRVSIGVSATLCKYILLPCLKEFIRTYPHVRISISCQSSSQTMEALQNGTIDIGLVGEPDKPAICSFHPVMEIEDVFVATESYMDNLRRRAAPETASPLSPEEAVSHDAAFLLLDQNNLTRQYIDRFLEEQGIHIRQVIDVTTMDLLIEFAKIDLGIACVIRNFVEKELSEGSLLPVFPSLSIPRRRIGFVCPNRANPDPYVQQLIGFFLDSCAKLPRPAPSQVLSSAQSQGQEPAERPPRPQSAPRTSPRLSP